MSGSPIVNGRGEGGGRARLARLISGWQRRPASSLLSRRDVLHEHLALIRTTTTVAEAVKVHQDRRLKGLSPLGLRRIAVAVAPACGALCPPAQRPSGPLSNTGLSETLQESTKP